MVDKSKSIRTLHVRNGKEIISIDIACDLNKVLYTPRIENYSTEIISANKIKNYELATGF